MKVIEACLGRSGLTLRSGLEAVPDGVFAFQPGDFDERGELVEEPARIATGLVSARHLLTVGDVLFKSRGTKNTAWAVTPEFQGRAVAIMPLFVLHPLESLLEPEYLSWALNQDRAQKQFAAGATGTTVRAINMPVLLGVDIPIPDQRTQQRIGKLAAARSRELTLNGRLMELKGQVLQHKLDDVLRPISQEQQPRSSRT